MHSSFPTAPSNLHIAIDFGAAGLDVAYVINDEIYIQEKWKSLTTANETIIKPKCVALFDPNKKLDSFGIAAKHKYYRLSSKQRKTWMLFDQFKMALDAQKRSRRRSTQFIKIKHELSASNSLTMSSKDVFVALFEYIYKNCMEWLHDKGITRTNKRNIDWIITVPVVWNEDAKHCMKSWAQTAGLKTIRILYEADCAALSILHYMKRKGEIEKGDKFILVDAGAGTVDVIAHRILSEFEVKMISPAHGDSYGSMGIDNKFNDLLNKLFGKTAMRKYKKECSPNYAQLMSNFNAAKHACFSKEGAECHNVKLPLGFWSHMKRKKRNVFSQQDARAVRLENKYLVMNIALWRDLFDDVQNKILRQIKKLLHEDVMRDCKYLCMVGGLSRSPYFQHRVEEEFGRNTRYRLQVIVPQRPTLCVVQGACFQRIQHNFIKARKLNKTYGVRVNLPLSTALEQGIPQEHIANNLVFDQETKRCHVRNCFEIIAAKGEEIFTNMVKKKKSKRLSCKQQAILKYILCSDMKEPKVVSDGDKLGSIKLEFDDDVKDMVINTEFHFDDANFKVFVYPKSKPYLRKEVQLSYA